MLVLTLTAASRGPQNLQGRIRDEKHPSHIDTLPLTPQSHPQAPLPSHVTGAALRTLLREGIGAEKLGVMLPATRSGVCVLSPGDQEVPELL